MFQSMILVAALAAAGASDASQCAAIMDDGERLACYDALHRSTEPGAAASERAAERAPPGAQTAPPTPASATGVAQEGATAPDPGKDFGLTAQQRDERDGVDARLDEIRAVVVEIHESRAGKPAYTLDNGQRWRQTESTSRPLLKVGATVVIKRGSLGSFMAKMPDFGGPPAWVRREE